MPRRPLNPCRNPTCPNRIEGAGYCPTCRAARNQEYYRQRRADPAKDDGFYRTTPWRKLRAAKLRAKPLCEDCERAGRVRAATCVDHIVPIRQGGEKLAWENLQSLCDTCHARKSVLEGSRFGGAG